MSNNSNNNYLCQHTNRDEIISKLQNKESWRESTGCTPNRRNLIGASNAHPMSQVEIARYLANNRIKR